MAGLRGAGKIYINTYNGGVWSGFLDMANIASFTIGNDGGDSVTLKSTAPVNYGAVIGSANTPGDDTISIALNDPNRKNLTAMLLGSDQVVTNAGASDGDEDLTVTALGTFLPLAKRRVSAVTVTATDGDSAVAWAADTVIALNEYRKPTTANGYYYKATAVAGDFKTAEVTQPTWPTTIGETVVDDQVTWTTIGKITKVADTDYVVDTDNGLIEILTGATGGYELGRAITVVYTHGAYTGYSINARTQSSLTCKVLFTGENLDNGNLIRLVANSVELSPEGDFSLVSADGEFLEFTLSGTIKVPDGETVPFTLEVID
jgi:hypothetical protein